MFSGSSSVPRVLLLPFHTPTPARTRVSLVKSVITIPTALVLAAVPRQRQNPTITRTRKRAQ